MRGGGRRRTRAARGRGAGDRHGRAGHRRRLPRAAALAGADGPRLRRAARGRHRARLRAARSRPGTAALVAAPRATARLARSLRGAGELPTRRARGGSARPLRRAGAARAGERGRARRRCGVRAGCWRSALALAVVGWALDTQTEVVSDVERLVPQDLPARARPPDAAALDRRRRRDRRPGRRRRPHRPGGRQVDARLPGRRARALRLLGRARLRQGRAVPGALAARPLPLRRRRPATASGSARCSTPFRRTSRRR